MNCQIDLEFENFQRKHGNNIDALAARVNPNESTDFFEPVILDRFQELVNEMGFAISLDRKLPGDTKSYVSILEGVVSLKDYKDLPEEASHILIELMDKEDKLYKRMYRDITKYKRYNLIKEAYKDTYTKERQFRHEAMAQVLADKLVNDLDENIIKQRQTNSWWKRLMKFFKDNFVPTSAFEEFSNLITSRNYDKVKVNKRLYDQVNELTVKDDGVYKNNIKVGSYTVEDGTLTSFDVNHAYKNYDRAAYMKLAGSLARQGIKLKSPVYVVSAKLYNALKEQGVVSQKTVELSNEMDEYFYPIDSIYYSSKGIFNDVMSKVTSFEETREVTEANINYFLRNKTTKSAKGWLFRGDEYETESEIKAAIKSYLEQRASRAVAWKDQLINILSNRKFPKDFDFLNLNYNNQVKYLETLLRGTIDSAKAEKVNVLGQDVILIKEGNFYTIIVTSTTNPSYNAKLIGHKIHGIHAGRRGHTLQDNGIGKATLIAAAVAAEIKRKNPTASFNDPKLAGPNSVNILSIHEGIRNLKLFPKMDDLDLSGQLGIPNSYGRDKLERLRNFYESRDKFPFPFDDNADFNSNLGRNVNARLAYLNRKFTKVENGRSVLDLPRNVKYEYAFLIEAKEQLYRMQKGYNPDSLQNGKLNDLKSAINAAPDIDVKELNEAYFIIRKYLRIAKQEFLSNYIPKARKLFSAYHKTKSNLANKATGAEDNIYVHLFEKRKNIRVYRNGQFIKNADGTFKTVEANTLKLKDPKHLSGEDKEFVEGYVELVRETVIDYIREKMNNLEINANKFKEGSRDPAEVWYEKNYQPIERQVPPMRGGTLGKLSTGNLKGALKGLVDDYFNYDLTAGNEHLVQIKKTRLGFLDYMLSETAVNKALGLEEVDGELVLTSLDKNSGVNQDIQTALHFYTLQLKKHKYNNQFMNAYFAAAWKLTTREGTELEVSHLADMFNLFINREIKDINLGALIGKDISGRQALEALSRFTDLRKLALNLSGSTVAIIADLKEFALKSLTNYYGDLMPGIEDMTKGLKYYMQNPIKANKIMTLLNMNSANENELTRGARFKAAGNNPLYSSISERYLYSLYGGGTHISKAAILFGRLSKDGILDNFKEDKDGRIYYDWSMDKRPAKQVEKIKENLKEAPKKNGKPIIPYDYLQQDTLVNIATQLFGAMDDETKTKLSTSVAAKAFIKYKTYLLGYLNRLTKTKRINENLAWYDSDGNAELHAEEGLVYSIYDLGMRLLDFMQNQDAESLKNMSDAQKSNLAYLTITMLAYIAAWIGIPEDLKKVKIVKYMMADLIGVYNLNEYLRAISTPVGIDTAKGLLETFQSTMTDLLTQDPQFAKKLEKYALSIGDDSYLRKMGM